MTSAADRRDEWKAAVEKETRPPPQAAQSHPPHAPRRYLPLTPMPASSHSCKEEGSSSSGSDGGDSGGAESTSARESRRCGADSCRCSTPPSSSMSAGTAEMDLNLGAVQAAQAGGGEDGGGGSSGAARAAKRASDEKSDSVPSEQVKPPEGAKGQRARGL